jgi:diadenosine tetraphosphate (Ap4A) HIT family hydrolase
LQEVDHVHFHIIPKPSAEEGLVVGWPAKTMAKEELQALYEEMKGKL